MHALDSLRLERGFRHWGHDIGSDDTPPEAGLGFCVALDKRVPFIGREALLARRGRPLARRLVSLLLDDPVPLLYHDEPIWRDGKRVGRVASGAYGHTLGRAVALGWVEDEAGIDAAWVEGGRFEIEVALTRYPAKASLRAFFDPAGLRQRG